MNSFRSKSIFVLTAIILLIVTAPATGELTEVWTTFISDDALFRAMTVGPDDTAYVAGLLDSSEQNTPEQNTLLAFDSEGNRLWRKDLKRGLVPTALAAMPDGSGVLVAGYNEISESYAPFLALHRAKSGKQLWRKNPGQFVVGILVTADAIYVTSAGPGADPDLWLTKLSPNGKSIWQRSFDAGGHDDGSAIAEDPATGRIIVAGKTAVVDEESGLEEAANVLLVAYSPDGDLVWSKVAKARKGRLQQIVGLTVAPNGKWIYLTGGLDEDFPDGATLTTLFFQRLKGQSGSAKKAKLYDPTGDGNQFPVGLVGRKGKTFYLAASGRMGEFPTPFSGIILKLNNRGKLRDTATVVIDETDTATEGIGMDSEGFLVTAGRNGSRLYLRKDMP